MASPQHADNPQPVRRRRRNWRWLIVLLVLLVGAGAYGYVQRPWETKPTAVAVETVSEAPVSQLLAVNGRVAARDVVNIRSAVSGLVTNVGAREGASVALGDLLVQVDTAQPQALVDQAQAARAAGLVRQAQAQADADRARALGDNATRATREDAERSLTAASNEVARLTAALEQVQSQLSQYTITAPLSGTVLDRSVDQGQLIDTQTALFTVADLSQLLVETDVDELYSARIKQGLKALLKPVGDTVPQHGTVVFAAPTVDPSTGGRAIKIAFDQPVDLPVGLTVNANIIVAQTDAALAIPRGAVLTEDTQSHVLLVQDGLAVAREIEFSDWPADRVIVNQGLAIGDQVILDPTSVTPGQSVVAE
jgi:membrane fusion protein, multidrug efflux system